MGHKFAEIAFTKTVKSVQEEQGSRKSYARMEERPEAYNHIMGANEMAFIGGRDSMYMATVSETGWPYMQHRGGPAGFVKVLDEKTLGLPDFRGNRQYVSVGNLMNDDRVSLFFMDYANKVRLKMLGRVRIIAAGDPLLEKLALPEYSARVERGFEIAVEAFDWNCPQHIPELYGVPDIQNSVSKLTDRIEELEKELQGHKGG
jgi:predicted pyridoxine 5'-phosphate oxidase superfamily flavin-nucleotide-binding protein